MNTHMNMRMQGYIFSRSFMGERVPQHIQNITIRNYCEQKGYKYLLSATEYAMENCHLILEQTLDELLQIDGLVAYSLFQLPEKDEQRQIVYSKILSLKKSFHFAVEGLQLTTIDDRNRIENLWLIRKILPKCIQTTI
jgi:sporadic carbohydrate cluster protein (TIGR04323 family)